MQAKKVVPPPPRGPPIPATHQNPLFVLAFFNSSHNHHGDHTPLDGKECVRHVLNESVMKMYFRIWESQTFGQTGRKSEIEISFQTRALIPIFIVTPIRRSSSSSALPVVLKFL